MANITKEIKEAVVEVLLDGIRRRNGEFISGWGPVGATRILHENKIRIKDTAVLQDGRKVAIIHRRYAQRKVNLYYRELKPTIEWLEAA